MASDNALAPFLMAASERYRQHDSAIAAQLSQALSRVLQSPIVEQPAHVPPCDPISAILASGNDPLLEAIAPVASLLYWRIPGRGRIPDPLSSNMAAVEIAGPDGMVVTQDCRFGLFIQSANIFYPEHCHEAEELYLVLSGTAEWGTDEVAQKPVPPGSFIHHRQWQPHVMSTGAEPLLAMWGWTGNLDFSTYTMGRKPAALAAQESGR